MGLDRRLTGGRWSAAAGVVALAAVLLFQPAVLAFPYRAESELGPVLSERPIDPVALRTVTARRQGEAGD